MQNKDENHLLNSFNINRIIEEKEKIIRLEKEITLARTEDDKKKIFLEIANCLFNLNLFYDASVYYKMALPKHKFKQKIETIITTSDKISIERKNRGAFINPNDIIFPLFSIASLQQFNKILAIRSCRSKDFKTKVDQLIEILDFLEYVGSKDNNTFYKITDDRYKLSFDSLGDFNPNLFFNMEILSPLLYDEKRFDITKEQYLSKLLNGGTQKIVNCLTTFKSAPIDTHLSMVQEFIARVFFEKIHGLPLDERNKLNKYLPKTGMDEKLAWYNLEFGGAAFNYATHELVVNQQIITHSDEFDHINSFNSFCNSVIKFWIVRRIAHKDIITDLVKLKKIFVALRDNNYDPASPNIPIVHNLTSLYQYLDYLRHTFNYSRLLSYLPQVEKKDSTVIYGDIRSFFFHEKASDINTFSSQLNRLNYLNLESKITRFDFLRRIQLLGEIFSERGWGFYVRHVKFLYPAFLSRLRNFLCHPDYDTTFKEIKILESEESALLAEVNIELCKLRKSIQEEITKREDALGFYPKNPKDGAEKYWSEIQRMYVKPESKLPVVDTHLLEPMDRNELFSLINKETNIRVDEKNSLIRMVMGVVPFNTNWSKSYANKITSGTLKKLLQKAKENYQKEIDNARSPEQKYIDTMTSFMEQNYPNLCQIYYKLSELDKSSTDIVRISSIYMLLIDRIEQLASIVKEAGVKPTNNLLLEEQLLDRQMKQIEFFHACCYLSTPIIMCLNFLGYEWLNNSGIKITKDELNEYIKLRNALEHFDPIMEGENKSYVSLNTWLPQALSLLIRKIFEYRVQIEALPERHKERDAIIKVVRIPAEDRIHQQQFFEIVKTLDSKNLDTPKI